MKMPSLNMMPGMGSSKELLTPASDKEIMSAIDQAYDFVSSIAKKDHGLELGRYAPLTKVNLTEAVQGGLMQMAERAQIDPGEMVETLLKTPKKDHQRIFGSTLDDLVGSNIRSNFDTPEMDVWSKKSNKTGGMQLGPNFQNREQFRVHNEKMSRNVSPNFNIMNSMGFQDPSANPSTVVLPFGADIRRDPELRKVAGQAGVKKVLANSGIQGHISGPSVPFTAYLAGHESQHGYDWTKTMLDEEGAGQWNYKKQPMATLNRMTKSASLERRAHLRGMHTVMEMGYAPSLVADPAFIEFRKHLDKVQTRGDGTKKVIDWMKSKDGSGTMGKAMDTPEKMNDMLRSYRKSFKADQRALGHLLKSRKSVFVGGLLVPMMMGVIAKALGGVAGEMSA